MVRPDAVVVLTPPGGGAGVLVDALARSAGVVAPRAGTAPFPEAVAELAAAPTHRLTAADLGGRARRRAVQRALDASLDAPGRPLLTGLRLALRVPFLAAALPGARFVLVHRDLRSALGFALEGWRSGDVVSAPDLTGWDGPPWSLPLIPEWPGLRGKDLGAIVGGQWAAIADTLLADLGALAPDRWCVADRSALLEDPRAELRRLCAFLDLEYDQAMLTPVEAGRRSTAARGAHPAAPDADLDRALTVAAPADARLRDVIARQDADAEAPPRVAGADAPATVLASRASASFAQALDRLGASLLLAAPHADALVLVRQRHGVPNTHFQPGDRPSAIATAPGRAAVATRDEIWELRADGDRLVPRTRHLVGELGAEDLAYGADGRLWVATPSAIATLDARDGLVAHWRPDDGAGLTGIALRDGTPAPTHATTLGGALINLASGTPVLSGLCHPRSPRWHGNRMYLLEAGRGTLVVADPDQGLQVETVAALPGYARGLAISGSLAFVGLSQLRTPGAAAGLPLLQRVAERRSGVWVIDLRTGETAGFLRFEDAVQEIGGLALLAQPWPDL